MSYLLRALLRFLWLTRGSLASALLGVSLGVASVVGVHLLSERVDTQVSQRQHPFGDLDLYLTRLDTQEEEFQEEEFQDTQESRAATVSFLDTHYFALRETWRRGGLGDRVVDLLPLVEGTVRNQQDILSIAATDALAAGALLGVQEGILQEDSQQQSAKGGGLLGVQRRRPEGRTGVGSLDYLLSDTVFVPPDLAMRAEVVLDGRRVRVLGSSGVDGLVLADLPTGQRVLGLDNRLTRVGVRLDEPNPWHRRVLNGLLPGVAATPPVALLAELSSEWQQVPAAAASPLLRLTRAVLFNLAALSLLALVVAWLLTYQVARHALVRRSSMFARLHSLGVEQRTLRRLTLVEGLLIGSTATILGTFGGAWVANRLYAVVLGEAPSTPLELNAWVVGKAAASGVGVAFISYLLANRAEVSRGPALRVSLAPSHAGARWSLVIVFGMFACAFPASGLAGGFGLILGACLLLVVYLPSLMALGWTASLRSSRAALHLIPLRQVLSSRELRLGICALVLALATALGIGMMVDSFRTAFIDLLDRRLADDVAVQVPQAWRTGPDDAPRLPASIQPLVSSAVWRGSGTVEVRGVSGELLFADDAGLLLDRFDPASSAERAAALAAGGIVVAESFARFQQLVPGDELLLRGAGGSAVAQVLGTFPDYGATRPRVLAARALAGRVLAAAAPSEVLLRSESADQLRAMLSTVGVEAVDQREVRRRSIDVFEQTFAITRALTLLALLVATVALANALTAQNLQSRPSEGLLAVLGVRSTELTRLRVRRALAAGALSLLLALPLGLFIAWALCEFVNPRAFGWRFPLTVTPAGVAWPMLGGVLAIVLSPLLAGRVVSAAPAAGALP